MSFDLKVHHRDAKTGRIVKVDPYTMHIKDGTRYFERPKGSGELFLADGTPAKEEGDLLKAQRAAAAKKAAVDAERKAQEKRAARAAAKKSAEVELAQLHKVEAEIAHAAKGE